MPFFLLFFLLLLSSIDIFAQIADTLTYHHIIVDSILIEGNEITEEEIILRELTFAVNDTINSEMLSYNRDRIYSLGIFNKVNLYPVQSDTLTTLIISVEESWYLYPVPFFQLRDKDWDKFSAGLILVLKNFQGRNESLSAMAAFGYDPAFRLGYFKPSITKNSDIFFDLSFSYSTVNNKSEIAGNIFGKPFEQKFITSQVVVGRRFGLYDRVALSGGYNYVQTPEFHKGINASDEKIDRYPIIGAGYEYDTRDLIQFPQQGIYINGSVYFKGLGMNNINYQVINIDYRQYLILYSDLGLKWRINSRLTYGRLVPFYDYSFLGFNERIRGYFSEEMEGNHYYKGTIEFFYPIIKEMNVNLDFIPVVPDELLHYRVALYTQLFTDTGTTHLKNHSINAASFESGYGFGLTLLILPYNTLRVEYAFNEFFDGEIIIDLGVSF